MSKLSDALNTLGKTKIVYKTEKRELPSLSDADQLQLFYNLLAVIHRDGGHYQEEHGVFKAYNDAVDKVIKWIHS